MSIDVEGVLSSHEDLTPNKNPNVEDPYPTTPRTAPSIAEPVDAEPNGDAPLTTAKVAVTKTCCGERDMSLKLVHESRSMVAEGIRGHIELCDRVHGGLRSNSEHHTRTVVAIATAEDAQTHEDASLTTGS